MKYNNYTKFFVITILFLTTIQFSSAQVNFISNLTIRGIDVANSNYVYLVCANNECDAYGTNVSVLRFNDFNNSFQRNDYLSTSGTLPMQEITGGYTNNEFNSINNMFIGGQLTGNGYFIVAKYGAFPQQVDYSLYSFDPSSNSWTYRDSQTIFSSSGIGTSYYPVRAFNNHRTQTATQSAFSNTNKTFVSFDFPNNDERVFSITSQNKYYYESNVSTYSWGQMLRNINPQIDDNIYTNEQVLYVTRNTHPHLENASNFTTSQTGNPIGIIDPTNDYYFITDSTRKYVFKGNVSASTNVQNSGQPIYSPVDLNDYTNCANYFGTFTITSMDCINANNCIFVGYDGSTNAVAIGFTGDSCVNYQSQMQAEFNTTSAKLYSVRTDSSNSKYYVGGVNTFFEITQSQFYLPQCISSTQFCDAPVNISSSGAPLGCFAQDLHTCSSCSNGVCYNECNAYNTPNSCNQLGATTCSDSTTISACVLNNQGCYNYVVQPSLNCNVGEFCVQSDNLADCTSVTSSGTTTIQNFVVNPYAVSSDTTSYTLDTATKTIGVETEFVVHNQEFYTNGANYNSRTCDYKEVTINSMTTSTQINSTYQNDLTTPIVQDSIQRVSFKPSNYGNGTIYIKSQLGNINSEISYTRNISNKELCLYYQNGSTIYCDFDTTNADTLSSVDLEYTFKESPRLYTIKVVFNRQNDNVIVVNPQVWTGTDIFSFNITSDNTTLISHSFVTIPTLRPYTASISSTSLTNPCTFESIGTRVVRTYGNNNGDPNYATYYDYNVAVNGLGLTDDELDRTITGETLTANTKLLIALIVSAVLFFITFLGIISIPNSSVSNGIGGGAIMMIISIITFSVLGWLPVWIMLLIIIFDAGIMAIALKKAVVTG